LKTDWRISRVLRVRCPGHRYLAVWSRPKAKQQCYNLFFLKILKKIGYHLWCITGRRVESYVFFDAWSTAGKIRNAEGNKPMDNQRSTHYSWRRCMHFRMTRRPSAK
jgi:hypothetical protein